MNEWDLIWRIGLALALSASIGLDRELRQKSAGLRTYTLVGVGSALFMPRWPSTASTTCWRREKWCSIPPGSPPRSSPGSASSAPG